MWTPKGTVILDSTLIRWYKSKNKIFNRNFSYVKNFKTLTSAQSFHCSEKSLSICSDNQKSGFCIMSKLDWNINLVLNMAYIHNALVINVLIFANNIIIQQKSKKGCTVQLGFFANTFSCSPIWLCPVWSFLPCPSWFDK